MIKVIVSVKTHYNGKFLDIGTETEVEEDTSKRWVKMGIARIIETVFDVDRANKKEILAKAQELGYQSVIDLDSKATIEIMRKTFKEAAEKEE